MFRMLVAGFLFGGSAAARAGQTGVVHPLMPRVEATVADDGEIRLTTDGGGSWQRVLPAARTREPEGIPDARLPEPELAEPELDGLYGDELADALQTATDEAEAEVRQAIGALRSELETAPRVQVRPGVAFAQNGELVVWRSDGLWTSADLGGSWVHALDEPVVAWAERGDGSRIVGTSTGTRTEVEGRWVRTDAAVCVAPVSDVPSDGVDPVLLDVLVAASATGPALAHPGRRLATAVVPELALSGTWSETVGHDTLGRSFDSALGVQLRLAWAVGRLADPADGSDAREAPELVEIDGEVVFDDDPEIRVLAARLDRTGRARDTDRARTVTRLYLARQRLVAARDAPGEALVDRVRRALGVAELDARLDALTTGAMSAHDTEERLEKQEER